MNDREFSRLIRERDGQCLNCNRRDHLQCAHIIRRGFKKTRWDEDNAVTLCLWCHHHFTNHPKDWAIWVETNFPGRLHELRQRAGAMIQ